MHVCQKHTLIIIIIKLSNKHEYVLTNYILLYSHAVIECRAKFEMKNQYQIAGEILKLFYACFVGMMWILNFGCV